MKYVLINVYNYIPIVLGSLPFIDFDDGLISGCEVQFGTQFS